MALTAVGGDNTADTELPPAALLGDAVANPTAPQVGAATQVFSGTTWQRQRAMSALGEGLGVALAAPPSPVGVAAAVSAAGAAAAVTFAAVAAQQHRLTTLFVSYAGATAAAVGRLTVADGATNIVDVDISVPATPGAATVLVPLPPGGLEGAINTAMTITLAAVTGAVGKVSASKLTA